MPWAAPLLVEWQNNILSMENPSLPEPVDVASRIARQTLDKRGPDYTGEVRRLIDAGRTVMRRCGTVQRGFLRALRLEGRPRRGHLRRRHRAPVELSGAPDGEGADGGRAGPLLGG